MRYRKSASVCGVIALAPRPTLLAAALVATALLLPVVIVAMVLEFII
ncbi:MAG: hypothetical protein AAFQ64_02045 [Pseudomonadota bacterium]